MPSGELLDRCLRPRAGKANLGDDLLRRQGRGHEPLKEIRRLHLARAGRALADDLRVERERQHAPFAGGVGVREAAAERAARADREVPDEAGGARQDLVTARRLGPKMLQRRVADQGPDRQRTAIARNVIETGDTRDVDQR